MIFADLPKSTLTQMTLAIGARLNATRPSWPSLLGQTRISFCWEAWPAQNTSMFLPLSLANVFCFLGSLLAGGI
jgi:hypothetical protein